MKDLRGSHVSAIRTAITKTFGLQLFPSNRRKNSKDILEWKNSKNVNDRYKSLYTDEGASIENIANNAFPSSNKANEEEFAKLYVYTASVCDIILNPGYPSLDVSRKALELRFKRFKAFVKFVKFIFVI
jgi:hypothetical protein